MTTFIGILALLGMFGVPISLLAAVIQALRKKPAGKPLLLAEVFAAVFLLALILTAATMDLGPQAAPADRVSLVVFSVLLLMTLCFVCAGLRRHCAVRRAAARHKPDGNSASATRSTSTLAQYIAQAMRDKGMANVRTMPRRGALGTNVVGETAEGIRVCVQCEPSDNPVGTRAVQEAAAAREHYKCEQAVLVSNSTFTKAAQSLAQEEKVTLTPL